MTAPPLTTYTVRHLDELLSGSSLDESTRLAMRAVAAVLPFRVNEYVVRELIDWSRVPEDPLFQLTFPQPGMLPEPARRAIEDLLVRGAAQGAVQEAARGIRATLKPHPGGQMDLNAVHEGAEVIPGLQHKYAETVLVFPRQGQTCHAYCSYCFRWAQFVGQPELRMATETPRAVADYVRRRPEVTSVLLTGGDPLVMSSRVLRQYIEPLLDPRLEHLESIRIGTKALAYWPHRLTSDGDAADLLRLFEQVRASGRQLALVGHWSHPRELETGPAERAVAAAQDAGAVIRGQAPLIRHVNDEAEVWARMWRRQVRLGVVPYYMFVERDTGPSEYFALPLARAHEIYTAAFRRVSGLARTVRGPVMSAEPGKVCVDGTAEVDGHPAFVLRMLQARDPSLVNRPFFARFDESATWLDDLRPLPGHWFPFAGSEEAPAPARDQLPDPMALVVPDALRGGRHVPHIRAH